MNVKEFIEQCSKSGYSSKKECKAWCEEHPKNTYTEDDFLEVYRVSRSSRIGRGSKWQAMDGGHKTTWRNYNDAY